MFEIVTAVIFLLACIVTGWGLIIFSNLKEKFSKDISANTYDLRDLNASLNIITGLIRYQTDLSSKHGEQTRANLLRLKDVVTTLDSIRGDMGVMSEDIKNFSATIEQLTRRVAELEK